MNSWILYVLLNIPSVTQKYVKITQKGAKKLSALLRDLRVFYGERLPVLPYSSRRFSVACRYSAILRKYPVVASVCWSRDCCKRF